MTKKTMLEWFAYLDAPGRELTELEFTMMMLWHIRQHVAQMNGRTLGVMNATEHLTGMLGSMDTMLANNVPNYPTRAENLALALPEGA